MIVARQTQGIALMAVAMLSVPIVDGIAKQLSAVYSPLFLGWARYGVASLLVLPLAAAVHGRQVLPSDRRASHFIRTICLVLAMTLYFLAVARIPLATAASGFLVGPIVAVALSVVLLGERMTARKGLAVLLGVAGSLVILQPGGSTDPGLLLAAGSGVTFAFYIIATRHASQTSDPIQTLAFQCVVGTLLMTPQALATWRTPAPADLLAFAALGGLSAFSHVLSIAAFRFAGASTLSPLVYLELVGAAATGYLMFGEVPGPATIAGAAFIVAAGLILLRSERGPKTDVRAPEVAA